MENVLSDNEDFDHYIKVTIIGNSNVGKTSLIQRYCDDLFDIETKTTIGIETKL